MWVNRPRPNTDWWTTPTKQSHECCKLFVKCLDAQQTRTVTVAICSYWLSTQSMYVHIYTCLVALRPVPPGWAGTRKVKPIWISLKQETVSGSGISWAICKSAPRSEQITTPAPHHSLFLQARCPSCCPTNSVKALKADIQYVCMHVIILKFN